jgi:hypothetical protein
MIDYKPGQMYDRGWKDRLDGRPQNPGTCPQVLQDEYNSGYTDCHNKILEDGKNAKRSDSPLRGHPLYREAHEGNHGKVFLSD